MRTRRRRRGLRGCSGCAQSVLNPCFLCVKGSVPDIAVFASSAPVNRVVLPSDLRDEDTEVQRG